MRIHRVVRDLVTTKRNFWLSSKPLRVLEDADGDYEVAVCDMIDRTSTEEAPWTLVPANDKYYARVMALRTVCDRLEKAL